LIDACPLLLDALFAVSSDNDGNESGHCGCRPADDKAKYGVCGRPRTTEGKKQMLLMVPEELIKAMKIAAIQDGKPVSHVAEEAMKDWLAKRKGPKI
jgi:hypothetical protein